MLAGYCHNGTTILLCYLRLVAIEANAGNELTCKN